MGSRLLVVVWVLAAGVPSAVAAESAPGGPPPALVVIAPVEVRTLRPQVSLVGTVRARADSLVAAEVSGIVREVGARLGDAVERGATLAVLRDAELEEELIAAGAEVRLAEAELAKAEADLKRAEELVDRAVSPREDLDSARRDVQVWEQRLAKAQAAVRLLEDRVTRQTVKAPLTGVVVEEHAEVGEWVPKGAPVARISDYAEVLVRVPVPEQYIEQISVGQQVAVRLDALAGKEYDGRVSAVIPVGDAEARTFPVEVRLDNPRRRIRPGMTARVVLRSGEPLRERLVPKDALVPRGGRTLVYAVVEGRAQEVAVEVLAYKGEQAAVRGELPEGAPVIVRGNERVRPGQSVRVSPPR